jgi:thiamine-phosphate pyrophosphorylase
MLLIVITHTEFFPGEAEILNQLFAKGLFCCHVRKPLASTTDINRLLNDIQPSYYDKIALHQHHDNDYGIKRLHFTEQHRMATNPSILHELKAQGFTLSTSVHSLSAAQQLPADFNYSFFSPVFDSISKQGYHAVVDDRFFWPSKDKAVPMIALGGIDLSNIVRVKAMNFDGAAVMGALWRAPEQAIDLFTKLQQVCSQLAHT